MLAWIFSKRKYQMGANEYMRFNEAMTRKFVKKSHRQLMLLLQTATMTNARGLDKRQIARPTDYVMWSCHIMENI